MRLLKTISKPLKNQDCPSFRRYKMKLDLAQVTQDIAQWVIDFVEVPQAALGGWSPCPYARKARNENDFEIRIGTDPYLDLVALAKEGPVNVGVIAIVYDPKEWPHEQFAMILEAANLQHLLKNDIIVLEDHPDDPEIVNGLSLNHGTYAMALVQSLSELNKKAQLVAKAGFYDSWPEEYLTALFKHRIDPRTT